MAKAQLQALADAWAEANEFVTFVDLIGLCRLTSSHVHLPVGTLESLLELRAAQPLTLGARALLDRTLRSYGQRVRQQRRLAARGVTLADAGQIARLAVHQQLALKLNLRDGPWVPEGDPTLGAIASLRPEGVMGELQKLSLVAESPGSGELVLARQAREPGRGGRPQPGRASRVLPQRIVVKVVVETAQEAALFGDEEFGEEPGRED